MTKKNQIARMMKMVEMLNKGRDEWNKEDIALFHQIKEKHIGGWITREDHQLDSE